MAILADIVIQSVHRNAHDPYAAIRDTDVYWNLDVRRLQGTPTNTNIHLLNPLNSELGGFRSRDTPLTGAEPVNGEFLSLHYSSHDGSFFLLDHSSLHELESEILGDAGIFNPFTCFVDAFINFHATQYDITFVDHTGSRVTFDKQLQNSGDAYTFNPKSPNKPSVFGYKFNAPSITWVGT